MYFNWSENEVFEVEQMFIALFCILFGAFSAGQAMQFGPDIQSAREAAFRVFSIIEEQSAIDCEGPDQKSAV